METLIFFAKSSDVGTRLDQFVATNVNITRSHSAKLIDDGAVKVNRTIKPKSYLLRDNDNIEVIMPEPKPDKVEPENLPIEIVYQDEYLAVINKSKGIVVHPAAGNENGTLVNALLYHLSNSLSGINGIARPGIVHRIDKDTSGLILIAKNDMAHLSLASQIKEHTAFRIYNAIICGKLKEKSGIINAPIGRHPKDRKKMAVVSNGRQAITHYEVLEEFTKNSLVKCQLETGRTHQIRVHFAHIGHPLFGDTLYGGTPTKHFAGQCLHASEIEFTHPKTGERIHLSCPFPEYFEKEILIQRGC